MKRLILLINFIAFLCIAKPAGSQTIYNNVGHIPPSAQADWTQAGLISSITPTVADTALNVLDYGAIRGDGLDDFTAVNAAIAAARSLSGTKIIFFPNGEYNINSTIVLGPNDNNLIFQGETAKNTQLIFTVGSNKRCFQIQGIISSNPEDLTANIVNGSRTLTGSFPNPIDWHDGRWIIYYENSAWPKVSSDASHPYAIGQVTQLVGDATPTTAVVKDDASKDYFDANDLKVRTLIPAKNIGFETFRLTRGDTGDGDEGSNFRFDFAVNCWLKGVHSENTSKHHIVIEHSSHILVTGCYIRSARNYGDGGRGYGVRLLFATTNSLVENNILRRLRRHIVLESGANTNVFAYNFTIEQNGDYGPFPANNLGDISLHGNFAYANLFEHNEVGRIEADDKHGFNGPFNTFVRNKTGEFKILYSPNVNLVGNDLLGTVPDINYEFSSVSTDLYGHYVAPGNTYANGIPVHHGQAGYPNNVFLEDDSYHYSSKPVFLTSSYPFPTMGPQLTGNIPALDRYLSIEPYEYMAYTGVTKTAWPPHQVIPPAEIVPNAPANLVISNAGQIGQNPILTWSASAGADGYDVYKWDGSNWDIWTHVTNTTYTDGSVEISDSSDPEAIEVEYHVRATKNVLSSTASNTVSTWAFGMFKINTQTPKEFGLSDNFPNPFNPSTTIKYQLPNASLVTLKVYSVSGQLVATLVNEQKTAGSYSVNFDASHLASGTYIYRIVAGSFSETKRMVLIK